MKKRWPFLVVFALAIAGFIVGSFFDLEINQFLFSDRNPFGITVTALSLAFGYCVFSFFGGILFRVTISSNQKLPLKIVLYILSIVCIGSAVYFTQNEMFSINGFNKQGIKYAIIAWSICSVVQCGIAMLGVLIGKYNTNNKLWIVCVLVVVAAFIALVPGVTLVKEILNRPRYRIVQTGIIEYYPWYKPCTTYDPLVESGVLKEDFRSFPSGHAAASLQLSVVLTYLPMMTNKVTKKMQIPFFFIGFVYSLVVGFSRMLVGAHYLTDVCYGFFITTLCFFIINEIIVRKNFFNEKR